MKPTITSLCTLLVILFASTVTFAAETVHITVTSHVKKLTAQTCSPASCSFVDVKPGDCVVTLVDDNGKPVGGNYELDIVWTVATSREASSGMATGKSSVSMTTGTTTGSTGTVSTTSSVTSPRDVASGMPTGKRMHKPFTITKEWGAASPQLRVSSPTGTDCDDMDTWSISINFTKIEMK